MRGVEVDCVEGLLCVFFCFCLEVGRRVRVLVGRRVCWKGDGVDRSVVSACCDGSLARLCRWWTPLGGPC